MRHKVENCKVIEVANVERGTTANGEWQKINIVVEKEFENDWGESRKFTLSLIAFGGTVDKVMEAILRPGDIIDVGYTVSSRKFKNENTGKESWFTQADLGFFKAHKAVQHTQSAPMPTQQPPFPTAQETPPAIDSLPF